MNELELKYGVNPHQKPARVYMENGAGLPFEVLNGAPGYVNLLDALNSYALAKELKEATGLPAAASFKHVSPSGAAVGIPLDEIDRRVFFANGEGMNALSPVACAYIRARGCDRMSSFGDWAALSDICDESAALFLKKEVSDGIIAPGYTPAALEILKSKRRGAYTVLRIDPDRQPEETERRQVFGVTFEQRRNDVKIDASLLQNTVTKAHDLPDGAVRDLLTALITLKYTQSNSVAYARGGQTVGVGAGQQSRIHCTRLAGGKADTWALRRHEKVLSLPFLPTLSRPERDNAIDGYINGCEEDVCAEGVWQKYFSVRPNPLTDAEKAEALRAVTGVSLASDAFFPFSDNIERAARSGVSYIAQPGGSKRDGEVIDACDRLGIVMAFTGVRLFHH